MTTQRRTLELTEGEWETVEGALLAAAEQSHQLAMRTQAPAGSSLYFGARHRSLMIAVRQIQTQGVAPHDGGPVGTARYTVR